MVFKYISGFLNCEYDHLLCRLQHPWLSYKLVSVLQYRKWKKLWKHWLSGLKHAQMAVGLFPEVQTLISLYSLVKMPGGKPDRYTRDLTKFSRQLLFLNFRTAVLDSQDVET